MTLRSTNIDRISGSTFDVLVVGAGINGAVAGAVLASRGASVCLIDRGDFAGFTSEESSNLVWGGFKYLENYEFGLVRHLCRSRNRLIRAYPSNIKEIRFLAALDASAPYSPWFATAGAAAYWLIGNGATRPPRHLTPERIAAEEPTIDVSQVRGGIEYSDAYLVDNDARFVFGFVRSALNVGAAVANYVELVAAEHGGDVWRCRLRDVDSGTEHDVEARVLVNATGPFVDGLNRDLGVRTRHRIVCSKGIHLIVPRIGRRERVLAFFDDTQRLFYVIPMGMRSVIGTTDTRVEEPTTEVTAADRDFLLAQINKRLALPEPLTASDVISTRCGVRPLVVDAATGVSGDTDWTSLSRKHAIEVDAERKLISVFGGKLTDCLNVGRELYDLVGGLGVPLDAYRRDWYGEPPAATQAEYLRQTRLMKLDRLRRSPGFEPLTTRLWRRYGLRAFAMLEALRDDPSMADDVIEGAQYIRAELHLAATTEMVTRLEDFLRRRSKISQVMRHDEVCEADGLTEAADILFGADARRRIDEYFGSYRAPDTIG
ncbi:MAG: FAD-dependent oxidoreductase [Acidimicrobiia bacterium]|nr:FAD-dependent oxidoreductase [Acidimicrobiia bacterium]